MKHGTHVERLWRLATACIALVTAAVVATAGASGPDPIPDRLQDREGRATAPWIAARLLVQPDGSVSLEPMAPNDRESTELKARSLSRMRQELGFAESAEHGTARSGFRDIVCDVDIVDEDGVPWDRRSSLLAVARNSVAAFAGTVTATEPGFSFGYPVTLLRVEVTDTLKVGGGYGTPSELLVAFANAHFALDSLRFCSKEWFEPQVGDRVLLTPFFGPADTTNRLVFHPRRWGLPAFSRQGEPLTLTEDYRTDPTAAGVTDMDSLLARFSDLLRSTAPEPVREPRRDGER